MLISQFIQQIRCCQVRFPRVPAEQLTGSDQWTHQEGGFSRMAALGGRVCRDLQETLLEHANRA